MWEFGEWEAEVLEREGDAMREWWRDHLRGTRALQLKGMEESSNSSRGGGLSDNSLQRAWKTLWITL
jgi:hypothetical protein